MNFQLELQPQEQSQSSIIEVLISKKLEQYQAANWVIAHGYKANFCSETKNFYKFLQVDNFKLKRFGFTEKTNYKINNLIYLVQISKP